MLLSAFSPERGCRVPEHRARELLPLSMRELGDVIVPESTLDGDTLRGPDGETIGTLRSDGTVAVSPEAHHSHRGRMPIPTMPSSSGG